MSALLPLVLLLAQTADRPVRAVTDPGVITTRQAITPAGTPSVFSTRVYGIAWEGASGDLLVLQANQVVRLNWNRNEFAARTPLAGTPGNQSLTATGGAAFVGASLRTPGKSGNRAALLAYEKGELKPVVTDLGAFLPGAISSAAGIVAVPLVAENKLALVDANQKQVLRMVPTGTAPFAAVLNRAGTIAYVSNLGGRAPKPGEEFASPMQKPEEKVPVDKRGVASTGTVSVIDVAQGTVKETIATGLHPTALLLDEERHRLYVANGNDDSVTFIDTRTNKAERSVNLSPVQPRVRGVAPTALAISADGATLWVACGGLNAIAQVQTRTGAVEGFIPTAWYPNHLALSPDGKLLAVATLLGPGSAWREAPAKRFVHSYRGSVAVLPLPDKAQLASYTTAVAENNHLRLATEARAADPKAAALPVPLRSGEPSLIEHVVFIVKENRTYDQVLGDLSQGDGDPSLVMFGREVTPNQHKLAEEFVLLDHFFATGGNSADGHQWLTQANEVEYCLWPGYQGRSYPFDGTDPMAYSSGGFLWDYALAKGRTVKIYGEYAGRQAETPNKARHELLRRWEKGEDFSTQWKVTAPIANVNKILAAHFPAYTNSIPDVVRASIFLKDLAGYEKEGKFPNLTLVQLPSDHTFGASPGTSSPKSMVADNDYAVGLIVEGLSKSKFWPKMAIFIVEDDAQNGVDHVDGHRTTAFVASPYARRGHVDSTIYAHQSMLKTIELMLGLPTMSLFDLIANDMRASFTNKPDLTPFVAVKPTYDLYELNPDIKALRGPARQAARESARMNWSVPDAVPTERLNRILWGMTRGWGSPYPAPPHRAFSPLTLDVEDDDR